MRKNLVDQLNHFGIQRLLGVTSCAALFGPDAHLVHYTSALRYPVFLGESNYAGSPSMVDHPMLRRHLREHFAEEAQMLGDALFVPLGDKVAKALHYLAKEGIIDSSRVLDGLQHPSGANAERIAYMVGRKAKDALSIKTRADIIDRARDRLRCKIEYLLSN